MQVLAPAQQMWEIDICPIGRTCRFSIPTVKEKRIPSLDKLVQALKNSRRTNNRNKSEYAHGVSGPIKNALDWLVSGGRISLQINHAYKTHLKEALHCAKESTLIRYLPKSLFKNYVGNSCGKSKQNIYTSIRNPREQV